MTETPPDADRWICDWLAAHDIAYTRFDHPAVFTCDEAERHVPPGATGVQTKNLFLRDKKGKRHWLVVTHCRKAVDIRSLGEALGAGRLSFGSPERLARYLGVTPGAVTLLALAHAGAREVEVVLDADVWGTAPLLCHPMVNTATLVLARPALDRFLAVTGHAPQVLPLAEVAPGDPAAEGGPA